MLGPLQRKQGDFQEHIYTYSHKEKSKLRKKKSMISQDLIPFRTLF